MMAAKNVKVATDNLSCPLCYQLFKNPKHLPCHHSYCEQCLEKMQVQSKIICPECRKEAIIPLGGVKELDDNFSINGLVDFILKRKVEGVAEAKCDECHGEDPVVAFCPDCTMFLCHVCNEHQKCSIKSCGHRTVPLTELRFKKDVTIEAKPKAMMCREHDIELLFYCETCDQLVCMYCTMKDHSGHSHDAVKKMVGKHRQELKKITAPVEEMIRDLSDTHDNIEKMRKKIKQQGDEVNATIDQHYDGVIQKLMEQKAQLKQVHDTVSQEVKTVRDYTSIKSTKIVNNNNNMGCPWGIAFGKNGMWAVAGYSRHCVYIFDGEDQLVRIFGSLGSGNSQFSLPAGLAFDSDNHLYVAEYCNHRVQKFTIDGEYLLQFGSEKAGNGKLKHPNGLAVYNHKVYVTDTMNKCISVFQTDGKFHHTIGSGQLGKPCDVTVNDNNQLLVVDCDHHCIYTFTLDGDYMGKFGTYGSGCGQLKHPYGITVDLYGFILVTDSSNHRVLVFDKDGNYINCFGSNGSAVGQFQLPNGIAVSANGNIYISDCNNNRIQIFFY